MIGRFAEAALWILVALRRQPAASGDLLEVVRDLDGPIGVGTFVGALARLERAGLVERSGAEGLPVYRLTKYPAGVA